MIGNIGSDKAGADQKESAGENQREIPYELRRALHEISTLRNSLDLGTGDLAFPQIGGLYGEMETMSGFERHHIPSKAVQDDNPNNLPAILMSKADHAKTDSYKGKQKHRYQSFLPGTPRSDTYRNEISAEITAGNYTDVVRNEIYNIIDTCGHRYDGAIQQYFDALEVYLQKNGIPAAKYKG